MSYESPTPKHLTADDKLDWEIQKLQAEVSNLRKPWIQQPSSWTTLMTVFLGIAGIGIQAFFSQKDYKIAQIKTERAILDQVKAENAKQVLFVQIDGAKATLLSLKSQREQLQKGIASLKQQSNRLAAVKLEKSNTDLRRQINKIRSDTDKIVNGLEQINQVSLSQAKSVNANLTDIAAGLSNNIATTLAAKSTFDPHLVQKAKGLFDSTYSVRQKSFDDLRDFWVSDPNIIPALLQVANANIENLDGVANVLHVIRYVERRYLIANRNDVERFLETVSRLPKAKGAKNVQLNIQMIRDRFQRADQGK
jgi:hypothetical protein